MMPIPKLLDLIGSLHRAGLGGARKSALLSALLGGGAGAVTGSSDSRMSNFLKGSLIGGGAGLGLHIGAGRGGAAALSSLARSATPPTDRVAALKLMAGLGGGGAAGGALGGLGGLKLRELTRPAVAGIDVQDILSKYSGDSNAGMEKVAIPAFIRGLGRAMPAMGSMFSKGKPLGLLATPRAKQLMKIRRGVKLGPSPAIRSPDKNLSGLPGILGRLSPVRGTYESLYPAYRSGGGGTLFGGGVTTLAKGAPKSIRRHELLHNLTDAASWMDPKATRLMPWYTKPSLTAKRWQKRLLGIANPTDNRTWTHAFSENPSLRKTPWWRQTAQKQLGGLGTVLDEASAHYGMYKNPLKGTLAAANATVGPGAIPYGMQTMRNGSLPLGLAQMAAGTGVARFATNKARVAAGFKPSPTLREEWDSWTK